MSHQRYGYVCPATAVHCLELQMVVELVRKAAGHLLLCHVNGAACFASDFDLETVLAKESQSRPTASVCISWLDSCQNANKSYSVFASASLCMPGKD